MFIFNYERRFNQKGEKMGDIKEFSNEAEEPLEAMKEES